MHCRYPVHCLRKPEYPVINFSLNDFVQQSNERSKRDEERQRANEAKIADMLAQLKEGSPESRVKAMDQKTVEIQKQQKEENINELINILKAKTAEQDNLLKKLAESGFVSDSSIG